MPACSQTVLPNPGMPLTLEELNATTLSHWRRKVEFRIEINIARRGAPPVWHYLMEDDHSPCVFDTEEDAASVVHDLIDDCRVVKVG